MTTQICAAQNGRVQPPSRGAPQATEPYSRIAVSDPPKSVALIQELHCRSSTRVPATPRRSVNRQPFPPMCELPILDPKTQTQKCTKRGVYCSRSKSLSDSWNMFAHASPLWDASKKVLRRRPGCWPLLTVVPDQLRWPSL